jgi:hypothetical protein
MIEGRITDPVAHGGWRQGLTLRLAQSKRDGPRMGAVKRRIQVDAGDPGRY